MIINGWHRAWSGGSATGAEIVRAGGMLPGLYEAWTAKPRAAPRRLAADESVSLFTCESFRVAPRERVTPAEIADAMGDQAAVDAWLARLRWPWTQPLCPSCGDPPAATCNLVRSSYGAWPQGAIFRCRPCARYFTPLHGTYLQRQRRSSVVPMIWVLSRSSDGRHSARAMRVLAVSTATVHRLRKVWRQAGGELEPVPPGGFRGIPPMRLAADGHAAVSHLLRVRPTDARRAPAH